jgi:hypothetical protein
MRMMNDTQEELREEGHTNVRREGEGRARKNWQLIYIVIAFAVCLLPFVGMLWADTESSTELSASDEFPQFINTDGRINIAYAPQVSTYFEAHFAYRSQAVDAYSHLSAQLFATSTTDQVIVGKSGWLYYGGTLKDFLNREPMTSRQAENIVHNLSLMQGYTEAMGSKFVFTIAPNKNSLYPEHMPYYYAPASKPDRQTLTELLKGSNIAYVDLFDRFGREDEVLYYKTDSHWNYEGALMVSDALLDASGKDPAEVLGRSSNTEFVGDIERMLYPQTARSESSTIIDTGAWSYDNEASSVEDDTIKVRSGGVGSLLMFRDSFANNLIPLLSPSFETAHYSKLIPYDLTLIAREKPDVVIIERAERHIGLLTESPPIMPAPMLSQEGWDIVDQMEEASITYTLDGDFVVVDAWLDSKTIASGDEIYLEVGSGGSGSLFVPYYLSRTENAESTDSTSSTDNVSKDERGFRAFLPKSVFKAGDQSVRVLMKNNSADKAYAVGKKHIQLT